MTDTTPAPDDASDDAPDNALDEALGRVRAADPARADSVDVEAIRLSVAEKLDADAAAQPVSDVSGRRHATDSSRHRVPWIAVAASVCALALAAGVGFVGGRSSGGSSVAASATAEDARATGAAPAVAAGGPVTNGGGVSGTTGAAAPGAPGPAIMPAYNQRTVYAAAPGLTASGGSVTTARGYAFDATAVDGRTAVERLAKAMGVAGKPHESSGAWSVGSVDGTAAGVTVGVDGLRSFAANDPSLTAGLGGGCAIAVPDVGAAKPSPTDAVATPVPVGPCPSTPGLAPAPASPDAIAAARAFMTYVGLDPAGFQWTSTGSPGDGVAYVNAAQVVDGSLTGETWGISLVANGKVAGANGFLAPLTSLGDYPVVPAADAVARLNDPQYAAGFGGGPVPMAGAAGGGVAVPAAGGSGVQGGGSTLTASGGTTESGGVISGGSGPAPTAAPTATAAPTTPPAPATAGQKFPWPVTRVTISGATLGLAPVKGRDGSVALVPTYHLSSADGSEYSVVAVADSALDLTSG